MYTEKKCKNSSCVFLSMFENLMEVQIRQIITFNHNYGFNEQIYDKVIRGKKWNIYLRGEYIDELWILGK